MAKNNDLNSTDQEDLVAKFGAVFKENRWGNDESVSGAGSALASPSVRSSVQVLDAIIRQFNIRSICDVPCGDFYWMPLILGRFPKIEYFGFDIVPELIKWNRERYPNRIFGVANVCSELLPSNDLIFCKDLLLHLRMKDVCGALWNFKNSKSRYLLVTSNEGAVNEELTSLELGAHRSVNLLAEPYCLPNPIWNDNYLALWALDAIPIAFFDQLVAKVR